MEILYGDLCLFLINKQSVEKIQRRATKLVREIKDLSCVD